MQDSIKDRRTRFTIAEIRNAYLKLRDEDSSRNITIVSICKEAGISRGTFYLHYRDIRDVEEDIMNELHEDARVSMDDILAGRHVGHEKELDDSRRNNIAWKLFFYDDDAPGWFERTILEDVIDSHVNGMLKDKKWSDEEKRIAALFLSAAAIAVDKDKYHRPWKDFEKTTAFYDNLVHSVTDFINQTDSF